MSLRQISFFSHLFNSILMKCLFTPPASPYGNMFESDGPPISRRLKALLPLLRYLVYMCPLPLTSDAYSRSNLKSEMLSFVDSQIIIAKSEHSLYRHSLQLLFKSS